MKLTDYLDLLRERWVVVVAVVAVTAVAAVGLMLLQGEDYVASVRLRARPPAPGSAASEIIAERRELTDLGTEAQLLQSTAVAERVADRIDYDGAPVDLLGRVGVNALGDTAVMVVRTSASSAQDAVVLANAFSDEYLEYRRESLREDLDRAAEVQSNRLQEVLSRLAELDGLLAQMDPGSTEYSATRLERDQTLADLVVIRSLLEALGDQAALAEGFGEIIQEASRADAVRSSSLPRALVFGLLVGLPLALAVVLLLDSLGNAVRSKLDAEQQTGSDVLGVIPFDVAWVDGHHPRLATQVDPFSPVAEAYRTLSHNLARLATEHDLRTVLVTSPGDGEGKTAAAANLALAHADSGRPVVLVEGDLRQPRTHAFVGGKPAPGLSDVLTGELDAADAMQALAPGFSFVGSGQPVDRPDLLLTRADIPAFLEDVAEIGSQPVRRPKQRRTPSSAVPIGPVTVLVDSPAILNAGEVSSLATHADAVLLVLRHGRTTRQAAASAAEQIRRAGGRLVGVVLMGGRAPTQVAWSTLVREHRTHGAVAPMARGVEAG